MEVRLYQFRVNKFFIKTVSGVSLLSMKMKLNGMIGARLEVTTRYAYDPL